MQITEGLHNLGLSQKEAKVYVALLGLGQASAYSIADRAGVKKPTTYVILGELMQKGLVLKIARSRKQLFVAKPPDEFFALAEERLRQAQTVLPDLMALVRGNKTKVRTVYFEGLRGVQETLRYRIKEMTDKELVGFYASSHDAPEELIQLFRLWNEDMKKHHIKIRGIAPEHASLEEWRKIDKDYGREMKIVPFETYSANISIDVGDTFVRILAFRELQGVIIENPDVANTMRQIFEMVWKT